MPYFPFLGLAAVQVLRLYRHRQTRQLECRLELVAIDLLSCPELVYREADGSGLPAGHGRTGKSDVGQM